MPLCLIPIKSFKYLPNIDLNHGIWKSAIYQNYMTLLCTIFQNIMFLRKIGWCNNNAKGFACPAFKNGRFSLIVCQRNNPSSHGFETTRRMQFKGEAEVAWVQQPSVLQTKKARSQNHFLVSEKTFAMGELRYSLRDKP